MALVSEADVAGKKIVTYNVHLESKGDDRMRCSQLEETLKDAERYSGNTPILLSGDFNLDASSGPAANAIRRSQFRDVFTSRHAYTTPSSFFEHGRIIDWIFTRGCIRASQAQVHRSVSASDHYPLSANFVFV